LTNIIKQHEIYHFVHTAPLNDFMFIILSFSNLRAEQLGFSMSSREEYKIFEQGKTLWSVLDTAIDGIIIINRFGIIQLVNKAVEKMFGYNADFLKGKNISILMPPPDKERHDSYLSNYLQSGQAKIIGIGRDVLARKQDGTKFPIRLAVSQVNLDNEIYFTGILHDQTAQKHAEEQLVQFTQELESKVRKRTEELGEAVNKLLSLNKQNRKEIAERIIIEKELKKKEEALQELLYKEKELNQMKSRFVSMASHEFRTPLSTILSSAALIEKYPDAEGQEKRQRHVSKIRNAVKNLTNILNDFLSMEKLEEGSIQLKPDRVELNSFCADLVEEMSLLLKSGQKINVIHNTDLKHIVTDPGFLYNSLINIFSNAVKYSGDDAEITFEVHDSNGNLEFHVTDQGIGIPEEEHHQLFQRFFRAQNATNIQGTGLGLHIVKRYMDMLGGNISFRSVLNQGSTFTLKIPVNPVTV
jgi:two-component system, LuxR family, sensor kinase FixL